MRTILVIESHVELRCFIARLLLRAGHCALVAEDGTAAGALLARTRVDVIATDLGLLSRGTTDVWGCWRQQYPSLEFIALSTGTPAAGYLRLAAVLGAAWNLTRPFMSAELIELTRPLGERPAEVLHDLPARRHGWPVSRGGNQGTS